MFLSFHYVYMDLQSQQVNGTSLRGENLILSIFLLMLSNTGPICPTNYLKSLTWFTNKESKLHINPQHQPFQYLFREGNGALIILSKVMMSQ